MPILTGVVDLEDVAKWLFFTADGRRVHALQDKSSAGRNIQMCYESILVAHVGRSEAPGEEPRLTTQARC